MIPNVRVAKGICPSGRMLAVLSVLSWGAWRKGAPRSGAKKRVDETCHLAGRRRGAVLKEEVWYEGDDIVKYSLAYINPSQCRVDHGRVLGYDNTHGQHHRHFMGKTTPVHFRSYGEIARRFEAEVRSLWRKEDERED
jgi:hypothetical protein